MALWFKKTGVVKMKGILLGLCMIYSIPIWASFTAISAEEVVQTAKDGAVIIDVRRADEWAQYGLIPGSHKLTFFDKNGKYDAQKWLAALEKIVKKKDQKFILVCAHAVRTNTIGQFLAKHTDYQNIRELRRGINDGWINRGFATTKIKADLNKRHDQKPWYKFW